MAAELELSVVPVDNKTIDVVGGTWSVPFCTPPEVPKAAPWNEFVAAVIVVPFGIPPEPVALSPPQ